MNTLSFFDGSLITNIEELQLNSLLRYISRKIQKLLVDIQNMIVFKVHLHFRQISWWFKIW